MVLEKRRFTGLPPTSFPRFVVDEEKCTGCGRCVRSCPIQLTEVVNKKARPNERYDHFRCIACENCMAVCPEDAIRIEGEYRVHRGFWKNDHLFSGGKTWPRPLARAAERPFGEYEQELTETERVIYRRRSVRIYRNKPVEPELIRRVVEAGRFAPSAGNNQPWKFVVINNAEVIDELDQLCRKVLRFGTFLMLPRAWRDKKTPGDKDARLSLWQRLFLPFFVPRNPGESDPRARGGINAVGADPDYHTFFHAPALIIILADRRGIGSIELDTGICAQNMVLAAHSLGLGTCYVAIITALRYYPKYRKKLGIEEPFKVITSLTLGYPQGKVDNIVEREQARVEWID